MSAEELKEQPSPLIDRLNELKKAISFFSIVYTVGSLGSAIGENIPSPNKVNIPLADGALLDLALSAAATALYMVVTRERESDSPDQQIGVE